MIYISIPIWDELYFYLQVRVSAVCTGIFPTSKIVNCNRKEVENAFEWVENYNYVYPFTKNDETI